MKILGAQAVSSWAPESGENDEFFFQPLKDQPTVPNEGDRQAAYIAPPADVDFTDVGYVIRAEMPGVEKDTLEITVEHGELIILGRRKPIEGSKLPVN